MTLVAAWRLTTPSPNRSPSEFEFSPGLQLAATTGRACELLQLLLLALVGHGYVKQMPTRLAIGWMSSKTFYMGTSCFVFAGTTASEAIPP